VINASCCTTNDDVSHQVDGRCTTECDSGDWSGEVKQENLPVVKQEPEEVCYTGLLVTE